MLHFWIRNATAEAINDNFKASLITQNKFLNAEVLRLSERSEAEQRTIKKLKKSVFAISSCKNMNLCFLDPVSFLKFL